MSARDELAGVLAAHDDPAGWMWSESDQMVYACECGDHYAAGPIDVIQEHDVLAAAAWHRAHVADALLASPEFARLIAAAKAEALREAADEIGEGDGMSRFIGMDSLPEAVRAEKRAQQWLRDRAALVAPTAATGEGVGG